MNFGSHINLISHSHININGILTRSKSEPAHQNGLPIQALENEDPLMALQAQENGIGLAIQLIATTHPICLAMDSKEMLVISTQTIASKKLWRGEEQTFHSALKLTSHQPCRGSNEFLEEWLPFNKSKLGLWIILGGFFGSGMLQIAQLSTYKEPLAAAALLGFAGLALIESALKNLERLSQLKAGLKAIQVSQEMVALARSSENIGKTAEELINADADLLRILLQENSKSRNFIIVNLIFDFVSLFCLLTTLPFLVIYPWIPSPLPIILGMPTGLAITHIIALVTMIISWVFQAILWRQNIGHINSLNIAALE